MSAAWAGGAAAVHQHLCPPPQTFRVPAPQTWTYECVLPFCDKDAIRDQPDAASRGMKLFSTLNSEMGLCSSDCNQGCQQTCNDYDKMQASEDKCTERTDEGCCTSGAMKCEDGWIPIADGNCGEGKKRYKCLEPDQGGKACRVTLVGQDLRAAAGGDGGFSEIEFSTPILKTPIVQAWDGKLAAKGDVSNSAERLWGRKYTAPTEDFFATGNGALAFLRHTCDGKLGFNLGSCVVWRGVVCARTERGFACGASGEVG